MNYQKARQQEVTGKWHYTNKNDGRIYPIGDCAGHEGHNTAEEAQECYKRYLLDNNLILDHKWSEPFPKCKVCGEITSGMAFISEAEQYIALCDTHRTKEEVEKIFHVGESLWS